MNNSMTYEELYSSMVKKFTVEKNNVDYRLGDYMLMKARAKSSSTEVKAEAPAATSNLPVKINRNTDTKALSTIISYVNEKLMVKEAPVRDKTIRSFPLRTSITAFCSAIVVCALVISSAVFGINTSDGYDNTVKVEEMNEVEMVDTEDLSAKIAFEE